MLEYIGARALIERELRLTDFLVLLTTVANIGKILSFFECRQLRRICNYVCVLCGVSINGYSISKVGIGVKVYAGFHVI